MAGKRILIVDDEPDILRVVVFRMKKAGYEVITAEDGKTGLERASREVPDIILLDLRLPIMDGFEVCRRIKIDERLKTIPVIFLSASISEDIESKIKEYGADGYMRKPFEPEELLEKIKLHLKE
ncbi:MAG: response regulator [Candidatus Omnitrophica bacterium]|nr:response regulator [Candidatus Omnitrophota bacterium]